VFVILSAYFSGMETGLISLDRYKLEQDARNDKRKMQILQFLENPDRLFGTTLLGNNISVVIVSSLTILLINKLHNELHIEQDIEIYQHTGTLIMTGIMLLFAEIIPKALYREEPIKLVEKNFSLIRVFSVIAKPFVSMVNKMNHWLTKIFHFKEVHSLLKVSREDLSFMVSESEDDETEEEINQKELLEEALEFGELQAENVMTHRTEIVAFERTTSISEVIEAAKNFGFTRFPVIEEDIDHISGILIIYDLLKCENPEKEKAEDYMRPTLFVPESMSIDALLAEMQAEKRTLAIVLDAYSGTAGMITIEDIMEELVGEIEDEYDIEETELEKLADGSYLINGDMEIDTLNSKYDFDLPEGDYETVAGMVIDNLARIPQVNTRIEMKNYSLVINKVTRRKIEKVKLVPKLKI
jgi:CBS domain containing-hemolysin-like protein